jgi:hypothetical protein
MSTDITLDGNRVAEGDPVISGSGSGAISTARLELATGSAVRALQVGAGEIQSAGPVGHDLGPDRAWPAFGARAQNPEHWVMSAADEFALLWPGPFPRG